MISWANTRLTEIMTKSNSKCLQSSNAKVTIDSVDKCTGDASIIFTRGKKKYGYDLNVEGKWNATYSVENGKEIVFKGKFVCHNFDETNKDECSVKFTLSEDEKKDNETKNSEEDIDSFMKWLRKTGQKWVEECVMKFDSDLREQ
jgi:hypothetical protein